METRTQNTVHLWWPTQSGETTDSTPLIYKPGEWSHELIFHWKKSCPQNTDWMKGSFCGNGPLVFYLFCLNWVGPTEFQSLSKWETVKVKIVHLPSSSPSSFCCPPLFPELCPLLTVRFMPPSNVEIKSTDELIILWNYKKPCKAAWVSWCCFFRTSLSGWAWAYGQESASSSHDAFRA